MKTQQASMKAVFTKECGNAINHGGKMETIGQFIVIDKKTEKQVVVARTYMGRGRSASQVKAAIWVDLSDKKKPAGWMITLMTENLTTTGPGSISRSGSGVLLELYMSSVHMPFNDD